MKKLPIPTLEETKERYLCFIEPFLTKKEFHKSKTIACDFFQFTAPKLQNLLQEEVDTTTTSWVYKYWQHMYLNTRGSVNFDSNFAMDLKLSNNLKSQEHPKLLNNFAKSLTKVCLDFINGNFEKVYDGRGNEICQSQFQILKGSSRIPRRKKDSYKINSIFSNFITIFYKNRLFKITIFDKNGILDIENAIKEIVRYSKEEENCLSSLSFLSTKDSAKLREELYLSNQFFDMVESSLFNISIVDESFCSSEARRHFMLYLDGTNSWILKSLNFIYNLNDKSLFANVEHSFQDAGTIVEIIKRVFHEVKTPIKTTSNAKPIPIKEYVDQKSKETILELLKEYQRKINLFTCKDLHFSLDDRICEGFSKDAIMQMIMLYAHFKAYGKIYGVYEAVDMREYEFGRTECVRVVSMEAVEFIQALDEDLDKTSLLMLLSKANKEHKQRIKDAKNAKGIDRHLFGLHAMILKADTKTKEKAMEFFSDKSYKRVTQNLVSTTSTGLLEHLGYVLFTPVELNGLGIAYLKSKDEVTFLLSYHKNMTNKANEFEKQIPIAINKIKNLTT